MSRERGPTVCLALALVLFVGAGQADDVPTRAVRDLADLRYADPAKHAGEATEARRRAIAHYRAGLALERGSIDARSAWREAWRLLAGLPRSTTHFSCIYE